MIIFSLRSLVISTSCTFWTAVLAAGKLQTNSETKHYKAKKSLFLPVLLKINVSQRQTTGTVSLRLDLKLGEGWRSGRHGKKVPCLLCLSCRLQTPPTSMSLAWVACWTCFPSFLPFWKPHTDKKTLSMLLCFLAGELHLKAMTKHSFSWNR